MGYPIFVGFSPLAQGRLNPLLPSICNFRLLGFREGSLGQFNPNTTPAVIWTPLMRRTCRVGIWFDRSPNDNHIAARSNTQPRGNLEFILGWILTLQRHQQPQGMTHILKPSSNYSLTIGFIISTEFICSTFPWLSIFWYGSNHDLKQQLFAVWISAVMFETTS